jgi:hypothetical protein
VLEDPKLGDDFFLGPLLKLVSESEETESPNQKQQIEPTTMEETELDGKVGST